MSRGKQLNSLNEQAKNYEFFLEMKGNDLVITPKMGKTAVQLLLYPYIKVQLANICAQGMDYNSLEDDLDVEDSKLIMRDFFEEE